MMVAMLIAKNWNVQNKTSRLAVYPNVRATSGGWCRHCNKLFLFACAIGDKFTAIGINV